MGIIRREEYVCDFCQTGIGQDGERHLTGQLQLRKNGARGLSRSFTLILHADCAELLTRTAVHEPVPTTR